MRGSYTYNKRICTTWEQIASILQSVEMKAVEVGAAIYR